MAGIPNRSPTHRDLDFARLSPLGNEVEEAAEEGALTPDRMLQLAGDRGRPVSHYYAAAVLAAEVELPIEHPVQAILCAGRCQSWGALDLIDRAAAIWERHPRFDIVPRQCLDRCEHAAVCEVRGPGGAAVLLAATPEDVDQALAAALQK